MTIKQVLSKSDLKDFIDFPHDLYKNDPNYVPQLFVAMKELMSPKKNPWFKHSKADLFLAYRDKRIVGRIAAIRNNQYIAFSNLSKGFFGFFDVIEDYQVAKALLDHVKNWLLAEDLSVMSGPTNFSTNDTAGLLIDGFDKPPVVEMTYNYPYYQKYIEQWGLEKEMDLLAYYVPQDSVSHKSIRLGKLLEQRLNRRGITLRYIKIKDFKKELQSIKDVYLKAWEKNWGFVPPTEEEFEFLAKNLKSIVKTEYCPIAEIDGKAIGFALAIPDINQILINIKRGRLLPTGIFKLLFGQKKVNMLRIIILGVIPEYRRLGIEALFYARIIENSSKNGIIAGEGSWVLENNEMMNQGMRNMNAYPYKRYRIYQKSIK